MMLKDSIFNRTMRGTGRFFRRLMRLPAVLRRSERFMVVFFSLLVIILGLVLRFNGASIGPAYGGRYVEGFVGEPRFINPILATSDIDRSLVKLIYSGLTKVDAKGVLQGDLASGWEMTDGGKTYVFHLRDDVYWHDGQKFTADDVLFTINLIKDDQTKSPLFDTWKDITIDAPDKRTLAFHLKDSLASFPWVTTFGILPAHVGKGNLATSFVGTGPYKYSKVRTKLKKIESITLVRNPKWYGIHVPYIDATELWFYSDESLAKAALTAQRVQALAGPNTGSKRLVHYSLPISQKSVLFLNSASIQLSNLDARKKLLDEQQVFNPPITLQVIADAVHAQDSELQDLISRWKDRHITVNVQSANLDDIRKVVSSKKAYDMIYVSIEDGPQTDPYVYWHSSQSEQGLNFSHAKNPDLDKALTEQRVATSLDKRAEQLQKIHQFITDQALIMQVSQRTFWYSVSKNIHVIPVEIGEVPADRFNNFDQWYIKTRR